ncbi:MAG: glycoside hydrolase family 16 protein, partial [Cyclobacteriaceae bacterium]|nr:glycoside hydrolase family 16 protein [Cyclobacteriaceae bacterium]
LDLNCEIGHFFKYFTKRHMKRTFFLVALIISGLIIGCDNKPYDLVDGYIYVQKEGRENDKDNWELVWADEFNNTTLDTTQWTKIETFTDVDFGLSKEKWIEDREKWKDIQNINCFSYTSSDPKLYNFANGMLYLDGIVNEDTLTDPRPYLQGAIKSKRKFAFQYGKIEIRAKLEAAKGAWPAFWMLSENEIYEDLPHRNGEIDIMERLNYDDSVYQTTHSHWTIEMKQRQNPPYSAKGKINPDDFNVYGLDWYPDKLVYTVNGKTSYEYPKMDGVDPCQWPFDQPFYVMLDQQLGGGWVGEIDPDDLPAKVIIDWIRLYQ